MKIAICDDEKILRDQLERYLNAYYQSLDVLIDSFPSGEAFLEKDQKNPNAYDIVFLDIEMERMNGIRVAQKLRQDNRDLLIIFLTSHAEFAAEGYEVDAFRFLTKPIRAEKLIQALQDAQSIMAQDKRLLIKASDKEILLRYQNIVYFEAQNVHVRVRTVEQVYTIRKTLALIEKEVKGTVFFQPHRSYLINLGFVADYDHKTATMETGETIPLSRTKVSELREALMLYVKTCGR